MPTYSTEAINDYQRRMDEFMLARGEYQYPGLPFPVEGISAGPAGDMVEAVARIDRCWADVKAGTMGAQREMDGAITDALDCIVELIVPA